MGNYSSKEGQITNQSANDDENIPSRKVRVQPQNDVAAVQRNSVIDTTSVGVSPSIDGSSGMDSVVPTVFKWVCVCLLYLNGCF